MNKALSNSDFQIANSDGHSVTGSTAIFELPAGTADVYPANRAKNFDRICAALDGTIALQTSDVALSQGDSLEILRRIPTQSVDLVLTDPPYHSTKKKNIYGDADFSDDADFIAWMAEYFAEWYRILKPNGSLYLFCSSDMAAYLYVEASKLMNMHGTITWTKPNEPGYDGWKQKMKKTALRRWYPHSERIIFCSPAFEGNLKRSPFGMFLRSCRKICSLSSNQLTEITGAYGKVNNGGAVSNWETGRNIPSREQYARICAAFLQTGSLRLMPAYEDVVRAFSIDPSQPFTDVWDFMNVRQYRGKHPAEKPLDMLQHMIRTTTYPGDVILDCFSGSGSTSIASMQMGRRSIGIEIEAKWVEYAVHRIKRAGTLAGVPPVRLVEKTKQVRDLPLFTK